MGTIADRIHAIELRERDAVSNASAKLAGLPTASAEHRYKIAREVFKEGRLDWPDMQTDNWGHWPREIPIPLALIFQSCLLVDLFDNLDSEEQFNLCYGVTVSQFIELVNKGFIIPNILSWDSEPRKQSEKVRLYESKNYMEPIFLLESNAVGINLIRRQAVFSLLGFSEVPRIQ